MLTRAEPDVTANARGDLDASALTIALTDAAHLVAVLEGPACSLVELSDDALHMGAALSRHVSTGGVSIT